LSLLERDIRLLLKQIKHMPGRHDQHMHGNRFSGAGAARSLVHHGGGAAGHNVIRDGNGDIVGVRIRGKKPKPADATIAPVPVGHQTVKGKEMSEDELLKSGTVADMLAHSDDSSFINDGDDTLAFLYKDQGFDGKPDVISDDALKAAVAGGEREFFRGLRDNASGDYIDAFKNGDYYAGYGMYGNGTYMAYSNGSDGVSGALREAHAYGGYAMRIALKKDAKVGDYGKLEVEANKLYNEAENEQISLEAQFRRERDLAKSQVLAKKIHEQTVLQKIYGDVGRYATSKGYDGYDVSPSAGSTAGYFVLLNRTAIRVSDKTYTKGMKA